MDNQQGRLLSTEFMAGLMVGEGWFGFTTFELKRKELNIRPGFAITMNDIETMTRFIETAESMGLAMYIVDIRRTGAASTIRPPS